MLVSAEANGRLFQEMHVDGGATSQVTFVSPSVPIKELTEEAIGRSFFDEVAPCTKVQEFHGRFLEGVEKPGNLGAILRTADAAGVDAVIAADPVTDWGNPNTVRASKGTVFSVQVASDSTGAVRAWLAARACCAGEGSPTRGPRRSAT